MQTRRVAVVSYPSFYSGKSSSSVRSAISRVFCLTSTQSVQSGEITKDYLVVDT